MGYSPWDHRELDMTEQLTIILSLWGFPGGTSGKEPSYQYKRHKRQGYGNPLQYSCLESPMDRGAWRATVHGVTKSWTRLK